jgi:hypothetical protein
LFSCTITNVVLTCVSNASPCGALSSPCIVGIHYMTNGVNSGFGTVLTADGVSYYSANTTSGLSIPAGCRLELEFTNAIGSPAMDISGSYDLIY